MTRPRLTSNVKSTLLWHWSNVSPSSSAVLVKFLAGFYWALVLGLSSYSPVIYPSPSQPQTLNPPGRLSWPNEPCINAGTVYFCYCVKTVCQCAFMNACVLQASLAQPLLGTACSKTYPMTHGQWCVAVTYCCPSRQSEAHHTSVFTGLFVHPQWLVPL